MNALTQLKNTGALFLPERPDRRKFIGGSDIASIMGIQPSSWMTALQLWQKKTLPDAAVEPETTQELRKRLARGTIVEPLVATLLAQLHDLPGIDVRNRRYSDPDMPFLAAEIDAEIPLDSVRHLFTECDTSNFPGDEIVNVEIKTVHPFAARDWGDDGSDKVPIHYAAQVQWGLGVRRRTFGLCAALFGADDLKLYPTVFDGAISLAMRERALDFWHCVQSLEAPAPQNADDVVTLWPEAFERIAVATPEVAAHVTTLREIKRIGKAEDGVAFMVKAFMQDAESLSVDGEIVATYRNKKLGGVDFDKLKANFPDAYKACLKSGTTRALLLKE